MPDGQLIEFDHVTKRFGAVAAVSDFSARVNPGVVTGFLGPNGAGKTTTLRMLVGLERPTIGTTKIGGKRFSELRDPARVIGAMLENPGFRARRTVERHLIAAAKANSIPLSRVGELISFVGLGDDVETRIAALSLGMRQRLSAATALLGDPGVLVLDEPANGLDPEGIRWMRTLIRGLADEGRTVLVSSHVLSEVEQTADAILVIASGKLKFAGTMEDLADPTAGPVVVDAADRSALSKALRGAGFEFEVLRSGLTVRGSDAATIGAVTAGAGVALTTLQQRGPTLEDVFLDLVNDRHVRPAKSVAGAAPAAVAPASASDADEPATHADDATAALFGTVEASERDEDSIAETVDRPTEPEGSEGSEDQPADEAEDDAGSSPADAADSDDANSAQDGTAAEPADTAEDASGAGDTADVDTAPREDARPLPGIAGLAAVASLFNTPATASAADDDADDAEGHVDAEQPSTDAIDDADADAADADSDDSDVTRVIEVIPAADAEPSASDVVADVPLAESESAGTLDETDPTDEFFDAFTGDPSSEDDDEQEPSSDEESEDDDLENAGSEGDDADGDEHDGDEPPHEQR
ncbi:ABC transporter ATP-binding protein [Microbacterium murale]|uniref:ABC-2 type transport system ATP-binding protein n=1 Tax=Microbacterium murale TaxID=1081040 RepID=A0ABU0P6L8_9MICO|nr:ATP-binding cassette domain-containing protein [Microbacterium murale]MDQ0642973.1 ABC-2 type transport system ATP-binding protein [Microbacterium murale]